MKKAKLNRNGFLLLGLICFGSGAYSTYTYISIHYFPSSLSSLIMMCFGIGCFMMAYLYPHIYGADERARAILAASMRAITFALFISINSLLLLVYTYGEEVLTAERVLHLLICIMLISIPTTMVIYSIRIIAV